MFWRDGFLEYCRRTFDCEVSVKDVFDRLEGGDCLSPGTNASVFNANKDHIMSSAGLFTYALLQFFCRNTF